MMETALWRRPGCGPACGPTSHDPIPHEQWGAQLSRHDTVRTGHLTVDLAARTAYLGHREVNLEAKPWRVLAYLARRPGQFCSNEDLIRVIWGASYLTETYSRPGRSPKNAGRQLLSMAIYRLKRALGYGGSYLIETVIGEGRHGRRLRMEDPT